MLFIRRVQFFKQVLGCRRLLSTNPKGVTIQVDCAIIACLLINLWAGGKPTLRTYEMICLYIAGWATLEGGDEPHARGPQAGDRLRPARSPLEPASFAAVRGVGPAPVPRRLGLPPGRPSGASMTDPDQSPDRTGLARFQPGRVNTAICSH